jgi:cation diffusion facilitator CzcD-associated flavoprotein CzcO
MQSRPDVEILIIGTGFAGLGLAIQLQKHGFRDFLLVEKEPDIGGTWLVNQYPGCACDVQSHMYSFSFEPNPHWTREFASQPEILAYLKRCTDKHALRPRIQFSTQAVGARYDEAHKLWRVKLADAAVVDAQLDQHALRPGEHLPSQSADKLPTRELTARVVVSAMGGLSTPAYPNLPGLERFRGHVFHSQRWRHDVDLRGKRVAVVGTGASAIQFVPEIQPHVAQLDLYQRTAAWVLPKPDRKIGALEQSILRNVPGARLLRRLALYTQLESRAIAFVHRPELLSVAERLARLYVRSQVKDRALRKKLTPHYALGCKRVLMSNNWFSAVTKPNVEVITSGIREVTERGILDNEGRERPVDALIFGTGFRLNDLVPRGLIHGKGGVDLVDTWKHGPEAYKGTTIAGFPNMFILVGPNTGLGHNSIIYMIESQLRYVLGALEQMRRDDLIELEVEKAAQERFNQDVQRRSAGTVFTSGGCASYYLDPASGRNIAVWPDFTFMFRLATRSFDARNYKMLKRSAPAHAPGVGV